MNARITRFQDIPQLTRESPYAVDVSWGFLAEWIDSQKEIGIELCPDFQRGHIWTERQQVAFIEFKLRGGRSEGDIYWNHPGWMNDFKGGPLVLVDGLQRVTAIQKFLNNEITAYGSRFSEFTDQLRYFGSCRLRMHVNNLSNRAAVLRWYLEMNSGGTPHSDQEIARVAAMLDAEAKVLGADDALPSPGFRDAGGGR